MATTRLKKNTRRQKAIRQAKIAAAYDVRDKAQAAQAKLAAIQEGGSKGSFWGTLAGIGLPLLMTAATGGLGGAAGMGFLSRLAATKVNPFLNAATVGLGSGLGRYFGGVDAARGAERYGDVVAGTTGYGRHSVKDIEESLEGQVADLETSAMKTGLSRGASAFMLAGGGKYLSDLSKLGKMKQGLLSSGFTPDPSLLASQAPQFGTYGDIFSGGSLMDKYIASQLAKGS